jgi:hypothetical protein
MDPNDPAQGPADQTPPPDAPYGAPPAPPYGAPPYGAPPYGAPSNGPYGAQPNGPYGAPPSDPYGASPYGAPPPAWGVPAAAPAGRGFPRRLLGLVVGIIVVIAIGVVVAVVLPNNAGKVMFSKGQYAVGSNTCRFNAPVTEVTSSDAFYMIAGLRDDMQPADQLTLTVTKDGKDYYTNTIPAGEKFNCYVENGSIGPLEPGVYDFKLSRGATVEAEGALTVKQ